MISNFIQDEHDYDSDSTCNSYDNYYKKCAECKKMTYVNSVKTELKIIMYLCNKCEIIYMNNLFNEKIKIINKFLLLIDLKERYKYIKIKNFFIEKIKNYNKNKDLIDMQNYIYKMTLFIKNLQNMIYYHPGYCSISTFIFLLKNI